jgi:hypothetical protein
MPPRRGKIMHTDEYEISLSRELAVCAAAIKKLERLLADTPDRGNREEDRQALRTWTERKEQYETLIAAMKMSSS